LGSGVILADDSGYGEVNGVAETKAREPGAGLALAAWRGSLPAMRDVCRGDGRRPENHATREAMNRRYFASKLLGAIAVWPWHFRGAPIDCAEGKDLCPLGHCQVSEDFLQLPAEPHQRILAEMVASWTLKAKVCTHAGCGIVYVPRAGLKT